MSSDPWYRDKDKLSQALKKHGTGGKVATAYGLDRSTVSKWAKIHGIELPPNGGHAAPAKFEDGKEPVAAPASPQIREAQKRIRELETLKAETSELAESIREAAEKVDVPTLPKIEVFRSKRKRSKTPVDIVIHVTDMQYGEKVEPHEVQGGNYSPEIWRDERLPRWRTAVTALLEQTAEFHEIGTVWFAQGGDYVEGMDVFKGQEWHLAYGPGKQIVTLAPLWAGAMATIATTAKELGANYVAALNVVGNHGVWGGRKSGAIKAEDNLDFLTYEMTRHILAQMPDNGGIDWYDTEARDTVYFDAAGHTFLLSHGDQDRGGGIVGFAAVSGVRNDMAVRIQTGLNHRYHLCGHYHREASIGVGGDSRRMWSSDWCGPNNLSRGRGGGSEPAQKAFVVHPDYGITVEWPIRLAPGMSRTPPEIIGVTNE